MSVFNPAIPRDSRAIVHPDGPNRKGYDIRPLSGGMRIDSFITGDGPTKNADEVAICNLADLSERSDQELALYGGGLLPTYFNSCHLVASAQYGIVRLPPDGKDPC